MTFEYDTPQYMIPALSELTTRVHTGNNPFDIDLLRYIRELEAKLSRIAYLIEHPYPDNNLIRAIIKE
jgi:hypothetical protein